MGKLSTRNKRICGQTVLQISGEGSIVDDGLTSHIVTANGDAVYTSDFTPKRNFYC